MRREKDEIDPEVSSLNSPKTRSCLRWITDIAFFLSVIILVLLLLVQSGQCLLRFSQHPSYISTKIVDQSQADFPAITICPDGSEGMNTEKLREFGYATDREYSNDFHERFNFKGWTGNSSDSDPVEIFYQVTWDVWDLVDYLDLSLLKPTLDGQTQVRLTKESPRQSSIHERPKRNFGRCFTIHPEDALRDLGIYKMEIKYRRQAKQYIHRFNQYMNSNGRMGHKIFANEIVENQINYVDVRIIPRVDHDDVPTCSTESFDHCIDHAMESIMRRDYGCVAPWIMNKTQICTDFERARLAFDVVYNRGTNQQEDCLQPCNFFLVNVGGKNFRYDESLNGSSLQTYFFAQQVMLNSEFYLYPFLSLAAEIGGYVGLLLGVSFLQGSVILADWMKSKADTYREKSSVRQIWVESTPPPMKF